MHNRYQLIGSMCACLIAASVYLVATPAKYKVTGKVMIAGNQTAESVIDDIRSKTLVQKTIDRLPFQVNYYRKGTFKNREIYGDSLPVKLVFSKPSSVDSAVVLTMKVVDNQQFELREQDTIIQYGYGKPVKYSFASFKGEKGPAFRQNTDPVIVKFNDPDELVEQYYENFKAGSAGDKTFEISVIAGTPQKGAAFLDKLIEVYNYPQAGAAENPVASSQTVVADNTNQLNQIKEQLALLRSKSAEFEKEKKGLAIIPRKPKKSATNQAQRDIQLKTLEAIQPYTNNSVNQFVQIPYGSETGNIELSTLIDRFNKIELDKQHHLQDSQVNRARIADLNKQIAGLKLNISRKITDVKDEISGTPAKLTNAQPTPQLASLNDSISKTNSQLKAAEAEYASLYTTNTPHAAHAKPGQYSGAKQKLTMIENPGGQVATYPNPGLVYFFALLVGLSISAAIGYISRLSIPGVQIDLKKFYARVYELTHPKQID